MGFLEDIKKKYQEGNLPIKLIFINIALFMLIRILDLFGISNFWVENTALNSDFFQSLLRPWSFFTYMFIHIKAMHLLLNMLMLWVMGDFFYRYFNDKAFAQFYFMGGICGGLLYIFLSFLLPQSNGLLMGASAAIYSVLFAMVAYQPNLQVRLLFVKEPIKLLYVAIGFLLLGFVINSENLGGNISHVGGALLGYFYMKQFEKGNDLFQINLFRKNRKKASFSTRQNKPPKNDEEYADWRKNKEDKTNRILEKIKRSGYNSLTEDEKLFLFNQREKK